MLKRQAMKVSRHNINNKNSLKCEDNNTSMLRTLLTTKNKISKEIQARITKGNRCAAALKNPLKNEIISRKNLSSKYTTLLFDRWCYMGVRRGL